MKKTGNNHGDTKDAQMNKHQPLKTDEPLSEKDEVKKAEEKTRKAAKKQ
jgi:hypothetical protein